MQPTDFVRGVPDDIWAVFEAALPPVVWKGNGRKPWGNRDYLHALPYVLASGIGWEYLPRLSAATRPFGSEYVFDLDVRDYNLWMLEKTPVILILFDASAGRAYWPHVQGYFCEDPIRRPKKGVRGVRVRVPGRQG